MVAFFGVIGRLVSGSGFEDVLFQVGHCTSRSINSAISGSIVTDCGMYMNHSRRHIIERLFLERFFVIFPRLPPSLPNFLEAQGRFKISLSNKKIKKYA